MFFFWGREEIAQLKDCPAVAVLEVSVMSCDNIPIESEFALKPLVF